MLESRSGRFPRFIWNDPTRPFGDAAIRLERNIVHRFGKEAILPKSGLIASITAMAGHLRVWGESRERAAAAIHRELNTALGGNDAPQGQGAPDPAVIAEIVRLAVDSCYGAATQENSGENKGGAAA